MKFKLGPLENARTFYSPKGNTTVIRDTVVPQSPSLQQEFIYEEEPKIEVKISGEPTLEILAEETAIKNIKKSNERSTKN